MFSVSHFFAFSLAFLVYVANASVITSLSKVLSALDGGREIALATILFTRGVTNKQRSSCLEALIGSSSLDESKVSCSDSGLLLTSPEDTDEVTASVTASGGTIILLADSVDLSRGEGVVEDLAPAIESFVRGSKKSGTLIVLLDDLESGKANFLKTVEGVLPTLITDSTIGSLEDVFERVEYVSSSSEAAGILNALKKQAATDALARVKSSLGNMRSLSVSTPLTPRDLAAARKLGPPALISVREVVDQVEGVCRDTYGSPQLVVNFGALCDAAIRRSLDEFGGLSGGGSLLSTSSGSQIRNSLRLDLESELYALFEEQIDQLRMASFEDFKKGLSKLLVSPNLASDMEEVAKRSIASFSSAAKKMVPGSCSSWSLQPAKDQFRRAVKEHIKKRLLAARASGQFKPLPRKGVTVGLHWLLPKPFGNDFRQEPWMVHASDNMVYIPKDKITDVNPEDVRVGDWRSKIVPSPVGNEMVYMQ